MSHPDSLKTKKSSIPAALLLWFIKFYQKRISPILGANCRFRPSCSQYTLEAVEKYGFIKGSLLGTWRIMRCNPFNSGGFDPVK